MMHFSPLGSTYVSEKSFIIKTMQQKKLNLEADFQILSQAFEKLKHIIMLII